MPRIPVGHLERYLARRGYRLPREFLEGTAGNWVSHNKPLRLGYRFSPRELGRLASQMTEGRVFVTSGKKINARGMFIHHSYNVPENAIRISSRPESNVPYTEGKKVNPETLSYEIPPRFSAILLQGSRTRHDRFLKTARHELGHAVQFHRNVDKGIRSFFMDPEVVGPETERDLMSFTREKLRERIEETNKKIKRRGYGPSIFEFMERRVEGYPYKDELRVISQRDPEIARAIKWYIHPAEWFAEAAESSFYDPLRIRREFPRI